MVKKSVLVLGLLVTYFGLIFTSGEFGQLVHPTTASLTVNGTPQQYGTELFLAIALIITLIGLFISYIAIFNPQWIKTNRLGVQSHQGSKKFNQQSQPQSELEPEPLPQKIIEIHPDSQNFQEQSADYTDVNSLLGTLQPVDEDSTKYSTDYSGSSESSSELSNDYSESFDSSPETLNDYSDSFDESSQFSVSDKTCSFCGAIVKPNDPFCNNCGKRLN